MNKTIISVRNWKITYKTDKQEFAHLMKTPYLGLDNENCYKIKQ